MTGVESTGKKAKRIHYIIICIVGILAGACASIGSPGGGDYDYDPPVVMRSSPKTGDLNVKNKRIEIVFDELVKLDKPMDKVIVTPPQKNFPTLRAQNNKVVVELKDTLKPNTTYTIDFTDAIIDNNEGNPLLNYALSFSTGEILDTLAISGKVLSADNLEPIAGIYVGIHSDLSDTAFTKTPFLRISRTNELGAFTIKGIAPGEYKIYALNDMNRDYKYDDPGEALAFYDSVIVPSCQPDIRYDSIFNKKTFLFDSLQEVSYTRFLPDDIVLRAFSSPFKRQYLQKHERLTNDAISIYFGTATQMPDIEGLNVPADINGWAVLEKTRGNDTLKYWITDPDVVNTDTIALKISYLATDTLNQLQPKTDTLSFVNRNKKAQEKEEEKRIAQLKKKGKEPAPVFLAVKTNISGEMDVYRNISLEFDYPPEGLVAEQIHLMNKPDSLYQDVKFDLVKDTLNPRKFSLKYVWEPGHNYKLEIDSASIGSYNGLHNDKITSPFKVKNLNKYGTLILKIANAPAGVPAFVELLDKSDKVVRKATVRDNTATLLYLNPGTYYGRIIIDSNGNGKWDTGDYDKGLQPESVFYYNSPFDTKENWVDEYDWDITAIPVEKQKPLEITKNKPKDNNKRKREMQQRDARQRQNSNTSSGSSNSINNSNSRNSNLSR